MADKLDKTTRGILGDIISGVATASRTTKTMTAPDRAMSAKAVVSRPKPAAAATTTIAAARRAEISEIGPNSPAPTTSYYT